ncbi:MAG: DUF262 domain-containing protein [Bacteroidetes bacterium]|nr:DUF262 domain-containing protein [Bacteroidota bacterium]
MKTKVLPLKVLSINNIYNGEKLIYEVPIYQRNYAWAKEEIFTLIQDVYDAYDDKRTNYYIGTLVTFHKGDQVYEVIDGQQRLTTINLVLGALGIDRQNKLTYRARKKSNDTIQSIPDFEIDEKDLGIINGYNYAKEAIDEIITSDSKIRAAFKEYFLQKVQIIHYQVPKDIDLNHYFEIMNSRGEQLEKHEIIKARLIQELNDADKGRFHQLWEFCTEMGIYVQQKYRSEKIFGKNHNYFTISEFNGIPAVEKNYGAKSILELINSKEANYAQTEQDQLDSFQPIIDFSNFLLIVLKLTRMDEADFDPVKFTLDDKELIREFDKVKINEKFVKKFGFNLLKAKYYLDNYMVHHSNEDDTIDNNPWKLQYWYKDGRKEYLKNIIEDDNDQNKLVQLLSMFEVSFTARQRKNYLFYCLLHLFKNDDLKAYIKFATGLAEKYMKDVYLKAEKLNQINTPSPGSFDETVLRSNELDISIGNKTLNFPDIYGDGSEESKGTPLFIFNYLDYKLWEKYSDELRGEKTTEGSRERKDFFKSLGCNDFGLNVFKKFYFSRTRRSLEHFYPQALATGKDGKLNQTQINCLGNYAMIGNAANSSGSNWTPNTKRFHYLDESGKINQVSVASIKFMIMMQKCKDNQESRQNGEEWDFTDIINHQAEMLEILLGKYS